MLRRIAGGGEDNGTNSFEAKTEAKEEIRLINVSILHQCLYR